MPFRSLPDLRDWLARAPNGTTLRADELVLLLEEVLETDDDVPAIAEPTEPVPWTWRERLWHCPAETMLGVRELTDALDRSADWVYRACSTDWAKKRERAPIPHSKLDGMLVFRAGEVRAWLRSELQVIVAGEMESTAAERRDWRKAS